MTGALAELTRVLLMLPQVELARRAEGPAPLVNRFRVLGRRRRTRSVAERKRLQRVIARVDACLPDRGNCYRRALLEIALDAGAAAEPFHMGLKASCAPLSGHAWVGTQATGESAYDAIIAL